MNNSKELVFWVSALFVCVIVFSTDIFSVHTIIHRRSRFVMSPKEFIKSREKAIVNNPYAAVVARVRNGNGLHPNEREFIQTRQEKVKQALEKQFDCLLEGKHIPKISLICSGGGYRAMLGTIGCLAGLCEIGVLDMITYVSSLSGSTWALGTWMSTGLSIAQLKKYIAQKLATSLYRLKKNDSRLIAHMLAVKIAFNQPCTAVDIFGSLIANHLLAFFGDKRQMVHMSDQVERLKKGEYPFPIYTAVDGRMRVIGNAAWYEFTPIEIGSAEYACYVPTWAYGRHFSKGISTNYAPEQSLGFHFGVFGSAFSIHAELAWKRIMNDVSHSMVIKPLVDRLLTQTFLGKTRIFWAKVPNYMAGLDNDVKDRKNLKLVDAGLEFNLPYPPVSGQRVERKSDILIFCDFTRDNIPNALQKAENYARKKELKFPSIDYTDLDKKTCSVFKDDKDASVPVVVYIPRISDPLLWQDKKTDAAYKKYHRIEGFDFKHCARYGHCETNNFQYTIHQSRQVMDQMEFNVVANKKKILDTIRLVIERME